VAINFPTAPATGQVYQAEGATFVWNGALWLVLAPSNAQFATKAEAEAGTRNDRLLSPLRAKEAIAALAPVQPPLNLGVAICRAWLRFDGVGNNIIDSYNVASAANEGTGFFRVYFGTPMLDGNYLVLANARGRTSDSNHPVFAAGVSASSPNTPGNCRINTGATGGVNSNGFLENSSLVHVSFWQ
jgi:hypothetical protein